MESQLSQYIGVGILGLVAVLFAIGSLFGSVAVGKFVNRRRKEGRADEPIKNTPYECGMLPIGEGASRLSVKFYLVALLFVLFDIESVFLYPWAVVYKELLAEGYTLIFWSMLSFIGVLFIGWFYAVKKGALEWKN